jgi:hypothetical protein
MKAGALTCFQEEKNENVLLGLTNAMYFPFPKTELQSPNDDNFIDFISSTLRS